MINKRNLALHPVSVEQDARSFCCVLYLFHKLQFSRPFFVKLVRFKNKRTSQLMYSIAQITSIYNFVQLRFMSSDYTVMIFVNRQAKMTRWGRKMAAALKEVKVNHRLK